MNVVILFALVAIGIAGWWLFARRLTARPWEAAQSDLDNGHGGAALDLAPGKVGLWMFLAVVTSFFGLLISAYGIRMEVADWRPLAVPDLLWINTFMLVLSSVSFQWTRVTAQKDSSEGVKIGLIASGAFALAFLAGQLVAWQRLEDSGQFMSNNIASAFFYLLTGLHGLHLLGGMVVWGKTTVRTWRGNAKLTDSRASIELCAIYWHFLLVVWLVLFAVLLSQTSLRNIWLGVCSVVGYGQ